MSRSYLHDKESKFTLEVDSEMKAKRIDEQIENYSTMHLNSKYHLYQSEEESKQIAEEFVHENEASLLSIFFKA